jgi:hypothetical protein
MTAPLYIPPPPPDCLRRPIPLAAPAAAGAEGVSVLASGTVGPFGYDVVTSPDPGEMVRWLRDNGYRIDPAMEPLIAVYTDEGMPFLAMKLQPGKNTSEIVPIKMQYDATQPMIPIRLTAVAAQPNMDIYTWIFAQGRTAPLNYVDMTISDGEVGFNPFGQNNYRQVLVQAKDQVGGHGFVTEYAGPTTKLKPSDPGVQLLVQQYPYVTQFHTRMSAQDMTVDPFFDLAPDKGDVNNVHDLSKAPPPWDCTDDSSTFKTIPGAGAAPPAAGLIRQLERFDASGAPRGGLLALTLVSAGAAALRFGRPRWPAPRPSGRPAAPGRLARLRGRRLAITAQGARLLLAEALVIQGFHEVEHIVQVVQRFVLNIKLGAGVLGSVFDVEPVHFLYNITFLGLLVSAYVGLRRANAIPRNRATVMALLTFAVVGQSYHSVEHVVKLIQYFQTGQNGTPGILGHWFNVVWLHFWFNTILYIPVVATFMVGGFHQAVARDLRRLLPRWHRRTIWPGGQPA